ncbi:MAG: hypothetical protein HYX24_06355 [Candidatus Aenigmarchaeota archaeon]|nr:hypothetical protein [Candidatus Aenigmarchaeota archaeon]
MDIQEMFRAMEGERLKIALFKSALNSMLVFLASNLIASAFSLLALSLLLAFLTFFASLYFYAKRYSMGYIEARNPQLKEMLTTARENISRKDVLTGILFRQVLARARTISFEAMASINTVYLRVFIIVILAFATTQISPAYVAGQIESFGKYFSGKKVVMDVELKNSEDIFGEERLIRLGNDTLQLALQASNNEIDLNSAEEPDKKAFERSEFMFDVEGSAAETSQEKLPEDFELVKAYSLKIRE